jgi:hypothetical protein
VTYYGTKPTGFTTSADPSGLLRITFSFSVGPPKLSITQSGNKVIISWPNAGNYTLQENSNLVAGVGWYDSTAVLNTNILGLISVTNSPASGSRFFRLMQ